MNKYQFRKNLVSCIREILDITENIACDAEDCLFFITPITEEGKKYNTKDDYIMRVLFRDENIRGRVFNLKEIISFLGCMEPYFPFWIKIRLYSNQSKIVLFELKTSLRFRSPSVVMNQSMSYPPFIIEIN